MQVPSQEIEATVSSTNESAKALIREVAEIISYGNGVTYSEVWNMSAEERKILIEVLTKRAETMSGKKKKEFL